ncbi:MAG: M1 family metallopeptidase [Chthoniobacterales bacterium]|nr:M1 family metallopeptidase [Chthoniobacterales bacterium]
MRFLPVVLSLAASAVALEPAYAEKPFNFEETPGKLPKHVVPQEYAVRIAPDLKKLTFSGSETIKLDVRKPARELVFNAADITIATASFDGKSIPKSAITLNAEDELVTVTLPSEAEVGWHTLVLTFSGKINQQGQGLYYAPYVEEGTGAKKVMLGTQFEATDARRMFPCWDEPAFRAQFQLTAVVAQNFTAVSNMPVESERKVAGGKELHFAATPPMSSYLNVLCAGELDAIEKESNGVLHRVIATRGKVEMGRYALESAAQIVEFYNEYFGTPYPLPKLDEIAVPGGFGGAMENWGGITYFESALLFDPKRSSVDTKQVIYAVVAHEAAHQWFGDLITMAWWDNLWLNEGFASWMGSKCTAKFNPDWEVWLAHNVPRDPTRRAGMPKESAMEGDARSTTHPIQQPVATEAEANSAFDDITYKKGQSFIRMLESFLGEEVFRDGIRKYMVQHKLSNTTTADLWNALGDASGKPVAEIAAAWTEQPGFPVVKVSRAADGKITLTQERFTVNFPDAPDLQWQIPLTYSVAGVAAPVSTLMSEKTMTIADVPPDRAVKFNVEGAGNYRVQYDDSSLKLLIAEFANLSMADRVNLLSDAWALVQANRAPLSLYLGLVDKLPSATQLAEREQVINAFALIDRLVSGTDKHSQFQQYARRVLRPSFEAIGWELKPGESVRDAELRATLVRALAGFADEEVIATCRKRFEKFLADSESLPPDLRPAVLDVVGHYADEKTWNKLHELGLKTNSVEEKQNYYAALAGAQDSELAMRSLQLALTNELPTSRALAIVPRVARDSGHPDIAWDFARENMKQLLGKADALAVNSYAPSMFTFFSDPTRISELKTYADSNLPVGARKAVDEAADEISFRAEFKDRLSKQVSETTSAAEPRN